MVSRGGRGRRSKMTAIGGRNACAVKGTMMMWDSGSWSGADWMLMGFGMLLFWALVVAGIVWAVRSTSGSAARRDGVSLHKPAPPARSSAHDILDERYARGELSDDEYRQRRDLLGAR
jgi:putative membrane protein